nr:PREDICTED: pseudouridylate synthase 7 homolog isoform X1 [Bemisia tabaci]
MSNAVPVITLADEKSSKLSSDSTPLITLDADGDSSSATPVITLDECEPENAEGPAKNDNEGCITLDAGQELPTEELDGTNGKRANSEELCSAKRPCDQIHSGLSEEDVGITQYVSSVPGFEAVIKQRYSDFQVNEIDLEGNIAKLTSLAAPPPEKKGEPTPADKEEILTVMSEENLKTLEEMIAANDKTKTILVNVTALAKEQRKKIHQLLKSVFRAKVFSNTVDKENEKFIEIGINSKIDDRWNRQTWTSGEYLHFILHKENMDHSQTVSLLAHLLRLKPNFISAAGTKDKRAKTTQWISVRRVKADRIANMRLRSIWCGHYCYKKEPLKLGDLRGNQFRIALRNVTADDGQINEVIESVKQRGFINYYGLQRFGSSVVAPTHVIGKTILQKNWKEAVELILKPRPREKNDPEMSEARNTWWNTRDTKAALRCLRKPQKSIEGNLLLALDKLGPTAYLNSLEKLPRCTALLYVHGYQSYVWNLIVSRRIEEFGLAPIAGDLVLADDIDLEVVTSREELLPEAILDPESEVTEESRSVIDSKTISFKDKTNADNSSNDPADGVLQTDSGTNEKENGENKSADDIKPRKLNVRKLTQEDLQTARMEDIIYPLPGHDIEYPDNVIGSWYKEILEQDNLTSASFKQSVKLFFTPGSYRKMMCIPKDVSWSIMKYNDVNENLILSDLEELKGLPKPKSEEGGSFKAITVKMCLPSSSYATMLLREITKSSTSTSHQASLTAKSMVAAET